MKSCLIAITTAVTLCISGVAQAQVGMAILTDLERGNLVVQLFDSAYANLAEIYSATGKGFKQIGTGPCETSEEHYIGGTCGLRYERNFRGSKIRYQAEGGGLNSDSVAKFTLTFKGGLSDLVNGEFENIFECSAATNLGKIVDKFGGIVRISSMPYQFIEGLDYDGTLSQRRYAENNLKLTRIDSNRCHLYVSRKVIEN